MRTCDDCGHREFDHQGSVCWGRVYFDDDLGAGPQLCGCNEFVTCDCGCRDVEEDS